MTTAATDPAAPASRRWRVPASAWYLLYLGIMLFQPMGAPGPGTFDWLVVGAVWAFYVPFFLVVETRPGWLRRHADVISLALGLAVMPVNAGASVLLVYAAAFAGAYRSRPVAVRWFAGLTLVLLMYAVVIDTGNEPVFRVLSYLPAGLFVWVVGWACIRDAERDRVAATLRVDNARIEHLATVNERERIARDLHDILGHTLTSVVVRAQLVQRLATADPDRAIREAVDIEAAARDALTQVRGTVQGWRQASIDEEVEVARTALASAGIELTVDRHPDVLLAPSVEAALALALREAVTNVVRHADAQRCTVTIGYEDGEVVLRVADDGRGGGGPDGGGLGGMRERIAALGGHVDRGGVAGTTLTVAVPAQVAG